MLIWSSCSRSCTDMSASSRVVAGHDAGGARLDRKSTRLNSSHANISYAVFCLKKKNRYILLFVITRVHYPLGHLMSLSAISLSRVNALDTFEQMLYYTSSIAFNIYILRSAERA